MVLETGVFRGRFSFDGEGGYTSAKASTVRGEVARLPNGFCSFEDLKASRRLPAFLRTTTLLARSRTANGSIELEAWSWEIAPKLLVNASVDEKVGELKIVRQASVGVEQRFLTVGPGKPPRSGYLKLPSPFTGSGHFEDPADGPPTWIGSLSVSLPGAPAVALAGPEFAARVCLDKEPFGGCKVTLPPGKGRPEPEL